MSDNIRMTTRHGETPTEWTERNLLPFEMGWSTDEKMLYINDDDTFLPIGGMMMSVIIRSNTAPTSTSIPLTGILWIDTSNNRFIPKIYSDADNAWHPLNAVYC